MQQNREYPQRWAGEVSSFREVAALIVRFRVRSCVIDALPETRKARELQADFAPGKIWLAYYAGGDDGTKSQETEQWNEKEGVVILDRTRSLDSTYARFDEGINTLPANARDIENYYEQMKAPVRVLEDKKDGKKVAKYIEGNRADHFAHSENYCTAAMAAPRPALVSSQIHSARAQFEQTAYH